MNRLSPPFLQSSYGLFLFFFRSQPNDLHRRVITPFHLQCYPRLLRNNGIPLAYSSWLLSHKPISQFGFILSHFRGLFNDHRQPIHPHWANHMFQYIIKGLLPHFGKTWTTLLSGTFIFQRTINKDILL